MYSVIRNILFMYEPEKAHEMAMSALKKATSVAFLKKKYTRDYKPSPNLPSATIGNLYFPNTIGLGAGFDKNAEFLEEIALLGFGFVEIGTVTPQAQAGNPRPRLFRLVEDKALINRMGFNNQGADAVAERLKKWRARDVWTEGERQMVIGGNIGKNKSTPNEYAYMDYDACFRKLAPYVDYIAVNVSSPNTPGLRDLQATESLEKILTHLQEVRGEMEINTPIFLKIAPDLEEKQLDEICEMALRINLDGLIATNTTIARNMLSDAGKIRAGEAGEGGLSGEPVRQRSTEVLRHVCLRVGNRIPVIASGGVFTAADYREKIEAGARLVQVWTGFIYEGPSIVRKISENLGRTE